MRKSYVKPRMEIVEYEAEALLANSGGRFEVDVDRPITGPVGAPPRKDRSVWD